MSDDIDTDLPAPLPVHVPAKPPYESLVEGALVAEHDARGLPRRTGSVGWSRTEMLAHLYDDDAGKTLAYTPGS